MGTSTDAILCLGFPVVDDDYDLPEWARKWMEESDEDYFDFEAFAVPRLTDEDYSEWSKRIKDCPAEWVVHCSDSYPMHIIAVRGSIKRAYRGDVEEVETYPMPDGVQRLRDWCEERGIEFQEPKWLMVSYWG